VNYAMKACDVIINSHIQIPNLASRVIIKRHFSGPQVSICRYQFIWIRYCSGAFRGI